MESVLINKNLNLIMEKLNSVDTKIDNFMGFFEFTDIELQKIKNDKKLGLCNLEEKREVEKLLD